MSPHVVSSKCTLYKNQEYIHTQSSLELSTHIQYTPGEIIGGIGMLQGCIFVTFNDSGNNQCSCFCSKKYLKTTENIDICQNLCFSCPLECLPMGTMTSKTPFSAWQQKPGASPACRRAMAFSHAPASAPFPGALWLLLLLLLLCGLVGYCPHAIPT